MKFTKSINDVIFFLIKDWNRNFSFTVPLRVPRKGKCSSNSLSRFVVFWKHFFSRRQIFSQMAIIVQRYPHFTLNPIHSFIFTAERELFMTFWFFQLDICNSKSKNLDAIKPNRLQFLAVNSKEKFSIRDNLKTLKISACICLNLT